MNQEYLYESKLNNYNSKTAVIVLPEIFGITDFITGVVDRFAKEFGLAAFGLDFFYQLNHTPNKFDYDTDMQKGIELMQKMRGEDFLMIFNDAIEKITATYPDIQNFIVCGFCFGGRLAYLSGLNDKVKRIISFYGAGANGPDYVDGRSTIEALSDKRNYDSSLSILAFYGGADESIPAEDRAKTKGLLQESGIQYQEIVYPGVGHAFFNHQRSDKYNNNASKAAWHNIAQLIQ